MKSKIYFENLEVQRGSLGKEASVPDLIGGLILQNELKFHLDEEDEIYEGYGRCMNSYPYRQFSCYSRKLNNDSIKTAVLENDYLKAVFLPELGGRLWSLLDKKQNRNLLYTNDVIRFSNLAIRNAWFSGGVEWNIGVIGHSPFTTAPLFTATLEADNGTPILRMYEYERLRGVTYQMDFWLGDQDQFLNARMRIVNFGEEVVPMYWWSNIAVPQHKNGRILVPAKKSYTFRDGGVYKVDVPIVDGVDVTKYEDIPASVDYFFEINKKDPKYIANIDADGYGLLHMSTNRLQSRKLFSWGQKRAGNHWQEFLTENAGPYIEIQAGLGKTQYGCIPMAPHTAWEWLERYGAIQVCNSTKIPESGISIKEDHLSNSFEYLSEKVTSELQTNIVYQEMESVLAATKEMAKKKAVVQQTGSGYGALKNKQREIEGKKQISQHLDFKSDESQQKLWINFLNTGKLEEPNPACPPPDFMIDKIFFQRLKETIKKKNKKNWYAHYQLGIFYLQRERYKKAKRELKQSLAVKKNAWAYHGLASVYTIIGKKEKAKHAITHGIQIQKEDLSYVKDGFRILNNNGGIQEILDLYESLKKEYRQEGRLKFYYIQALYESGQTEKAYDLLCSDGGLIVDDIREGEVSIGELWKKLYRELYGKEGELPYVFDFKAI